MRFVRRILFFAAASVLAVPSGAWACAACFGKSDSTMAKSVNAGIFSLMAVIVTVLAGAASFFVFLSRRAAASSSATPDSR
jgi:hypothetical protein